MDDHEEHVLLHNKSATTTNDDAYGESGEEEDEDESDGDDDDDDHQPALTLTEIREMKLKRNQAKLEELGLSSLMKTTTTTNSTMDRKPKRGRSTSDCDDEDGAHRYNSNRRRRLNGKGTARGKNDPGHRQGMLLPFVDVVVNSAGPRRPRAAGAALQHHDPTAEQISQVYDSYPHRHGQIRKLVGLLRPIACSSDGGAQARTSSDGGVPPPIVVVGQPGTGKTSVVRVVLDALRPTGRLLSAYVDCSALDAPTLGDVTRTLFKQLQRQVREAQEMVEATSASSSGTRPGRDRSGDGHVEDRDTDAAVSVEPKQDTKLEHDNLDGDENLNTTNGSKSGRQPSRMNASKSSDRAGPFSPPDGTATSAGRAAGSSKVPATATVTATNLSAPSHSVVAKFARDLRKLLLDRMPSPTPTPTRQVVLVLDQAERLLTLPQVGSTEMPNYLAQLMLVPRLVGVNVTVLSITTSHLLVHSRMRPMESTIAETFQPICVRFQNYNSKCMVMDILRQERMRAVVTGTVMTPSSSHDFRSAAYESFVDTLVQSMQTVTTNVKEISHLGQRLWPKYIEPLVSRESIVATLQQARQTLAESDPAPRRDSMQREVLLILDRLFRPVLIATTGSCAQGLFQQEAQVSQHSSSYHYFGLPLLAKYMLLSAYLCQTNRPDKDTDLFSIEANGKRRRSNADRQHQDPEEMGETASLPGTNLPRPRTFALERLLSVYSSVVGLASATSADDDRCRTLGGAAFYDNLSHLCESGLLHEHPNQCGYETTRLNDPRYWTSISADDAKAMAKSLNFPLDSYIL